MKPKTVVILVCVLVACALAAIALTTCNSKTPSSQQEAALNAVQKDSDAVNADDGSNASANEADQKESAATVDESAGNLDSTKDQVAPTS